MSFLDDYTLYKQPTDEVKYYFKGQRVAPGLADELSRIGVPITAETDGDWFFDQFGQEQ